MKTSFVSNSADDTRRLGAALARALVSQFADGTVVALVGELGAGKTTFVQGAAGGLGIGRGAGEPGKPEAEPEVVTSPTFVLVREHAGPGGRLLVHVDAHRLRDAPELRDLGSDDFLGRRGVAFVEWAERVEQALPRPYLVIRFRHEAEGVRALDIEGAGAGSEALLEAASRALSGAEETTA